MIKPIRLIILSIPLLMSVGCDTVEDSFFVRSEPQENEVLTIDETLLSFTPDGGTQEIHINTIASWTITDSKNNTKQFTIEPMSGRGNTVVKVTAKANPSSQSYDAELQISPANFEMEPLKVQLKQNNTTFDVSTFPSSDATPEEGGSVTMTAYSSVDWELQLQEHDVDHNMGNLEWITITPGISGEGNNGNTPHEFRFTWSPNYTTQERKIRLQFKPVNEELVNKSEWPRTFDLVQLPGTAPQNVRCNVEKLDIVKADVSFEYSSRAPITDCGVILYKVNGGTKEVVNTFRPEKENDEFPKNVSYTFSLPELEEDTNFELKPYCYNKVGETEGEVSQIKTGIKPENMVYEGVTIVNGLDGINVETDMTSATLTMTVTSDVEPLGENRIASAVMKFDGVETNGVATKQSDGVWTYVFKTTDVKVGDKEKALTPNKKYPYTIEITGANLDRSQGQVTNKVATVSATFRTVGMIPDEDENGLPK